MDKALRGLNPIPVMKKTPKLSLTNDFWVSVDFGIDVAEGLYPSLGVSFPVGPVFVSPGVWYGSEYRALDQPAWGWYLSIGYSWTVIK